MSHVTCHLTTTLYCLSCYKSPRRFGELVAGGFMIERVFLCASLLITLGYTLFYQKFTFPFVSEWQQGGGGKQTDIATNRLNRPRGQFREKIPHMGDTVTCHVGGGGAPLYPASIKILEGILPLAYMFQWYIMIAGGQTCYDCQTLLHTFFDFLVNIIK